MTANAAAGDQKLRVLYVAYPLLPVTENSAGGAEQVLWTLERELHGRGHRTTVAACAGSQVSGDLFPTGDPPSTLDQHQQRAEQQAQTLLSWLCAPAASDLDLIHDMSGSFWRYAGELAVPVLATLHLPRSLYPDADSWEVPASVSFNCVSQYQSAEFVGLPRCLGVVPNGVALDRFPQEIEPCVKREYLLWVGRICEEKGTHTALDIAYALGAKIIIAGAVYPLLYHQKYFAREVIPRLKRAGSRAKYIEQPNFVKKLELLRNARALLITSEVNETSSLVAMEAAACGTPVVALRRGALSQVVAEGVTGSLAEEVAGMAEALQRVKAIDLRACRHYAEKHYSSVPMADGYLTLYARLARKKTSTRTPALARSS